LSWVTKRRAFALADEPARPAGTEALTEHQLAALVTRDCMIGTAVPKAAS
ncbi:MAG: nitrile hydratase subunit alpha, partial [Pseudomonadota bacterium]